MILIAVVGVIGIIVTIMVVCQGIKRRRYDWKSESVFMSLVGLFITALAMGVAYALSGVVGYATGMEPEHNPYRFEIIAATDDSLTNGGFYLFGGSVNEQPVYFYYRQNNNGGIRQGNIPTWKSTLYEDTAGEGYVTVNRHKPHCNLWGCAIDFDGNDWRGYYEIHVPPGSVKKQFNFDLGN